MTDKQIIIDGVDVSGCECYSEHREGYCGWHIPCEGDICPYKLKWALQQLKRKEQECERLQDELILRDVANIELSDEVKKYRKAIDEIEEIADNNYEIAEMEQIFLIIGGLDV